jgi:ABC-type transport system involved in multi-copper enzyme maturation permease subunit
MHSFYDTFNVARFHIIKSFRSRTFLFLCSVYLILSGGFAWLFRGIIHELEKKTAVLLHVPQTKTPGAMIENLRKQDELKNILENLLPNDQLIEWALSMPILTITHFWMSIIFLPFLASVIGAELISPNIEDRSLRFELLRTGRMEVLFGRAIGQLSLIALGTLIAALAPLFISTFFMVQQPFLESLSVLLLFVPRLILWSIPFLGLGMACSMITSMTNLARIFALGLTVGSWIFFALVHDPLNFESPLLWSILTPCIPQVYAEFIWGPGWSWLPFGGILIALGITYMMSTYLFFSRRNL